MTIKKATYFHENRIKVTIHKTEQVAFSFNLFSELLYSLLVTIKNTAVIYDSPASFTLQCFI